MRQRGPVALDTAQKASRRHGLGTRELFDTVSKGDRAQSPASAILIRQGWKLMMVKRAAEIKDRRIVAKRVFDALCAAYPTNISR